MKIIENRGRKSLQGGGQSPVLRARVHPDLLAKFHRLGGAEWLRKTLERAREPQ